MICLRLPYLLIYLSLFPLFLLAQKEGNIWYFGEYAGLDFNGGSPVVLMDGMLNTLEGCASICDANGNLLFYTDGMTVYNKNHGVMPNGTGLLGNSSSTQSAIIVKKPESNTVYYIFTVDGTTGIGGGFHYSIVDMTLAGGLGDITIDKNILLFTDACEKVTAIQHQNDIDFWIVSPQHITNTFYSYLLTASGINLSPIQTNVTLVANDVGYLRASPKGHKIVTANSNLADSYMFDFDKTTGVLSNEMSFSESAYGAEFSPSSDILYLNLIGGTSGSGVYQYNLLAGTTTDILNSELYLAFTTWGALQLAPDGKIYLAQGSLEVINNPDVLGLGCDYDPNGIYLNGRNSASGLPTFFSSIFSPSSTTEINNFCLGDSTSFIFSGIVDSVLWDFGDGNSSALMNTTHVYQDTGTYVISFVSCLGGVCDTLFDIITIINPMPILGSDTSICDGEHFNPIVVMVSGTAPFTLVWSDGVNDFVEYGTAFEITPTKTATYSLVSIEDGIGCEGVVAGVASYLIHPTPKVDFTISPPYAYLDSAFIEFTNQSSDHNESIWYFGVGGNLLNDMSSVLTYEYDRSGEYTVQLAVSSEFGCSATLNKTLRILPVQYFVPDVFTPNADGLNDIFSINSVKVNSLEMQIYDRWGALVYATKDVKHGWDGTKSNTAVQEGAYAYKIEFRDLEDKFHRLVGNVLLVR